MEAGKASAGVRAFGLEDRKSLASIGLRFGFKANVPGLPAVTVRRVAKVGAVALRTASIEKMVIRGHLATNALYAMFADTKEIVRGRFGAFGGT